ncbi:MAG: GlsB/YeaQ/YmgE family stress response membrane protein [Tannerellaceae bacterium]|nr:GlsB/YeaQ/YmgE family stress response membrane protein [Tannerellaceae bacterium]
MSILGSIIIDILAGFLAGKIYEGRGFGLVVNMIVGLIGALLGGWIFSLLGLAINGVIGSLICAVIGAIVLLWIVSLFGRRA